MQRIWLFVIISFCMCHVCLATVGHADEVAFPYEAVVGVPQSEVHSGPGEEYYATGRLALNAAVEVYRHAPGGWLAVRPPEGSFSWIFDRHVEIGEDGLGRINKNEVPSRVGVDGSQQRNVIQVRLQKGEVVELLGQHEEAGQRWYKIAPPAGEFRWLHVDSVGKVVPTVVPPVVSEKNPIQPAAVWANVNAPVPDEDEVVSTVETGVKTKVETVAHDEPQWIQTKDESQAIAELEPQVTEVAKSGWSPRAKTIEKSMEPPKRYAAPELFTQQTEQVSMEPTTEPIAEKPETNAGQRWLPRRKASARATERATERAIPITPIVNHDAAYETTQQNIVSNQATPAAGREMSAEFTRAVVSIDVRLSQIVTTNRETWQLEPLRQEANTLLTKSQTVAESEAAKHTLGKLDRFAAIQQGFAQVRNIAPPTAPAQPPMVAANPNIAVPPSQIAPVEIPDFPITRRPRPNRRRRHDAEGVLRMASSRRPGAPEYALVNQGGRVVALVSATPDVDLEPFLGKRVGVAGERRFRPEFRKQHVVASRVLPLGEQQNRPLRR